MLYLKVSWVYAVINEHNRVLVKRFELLKIKRSFFVDNLRQRKLSPIFELGIIIIDTSLRKIIMRAMILFFFFLIISIKSLGQDTLWKKNVFNEILTLNLPANSKYSKSSYIKAIGGEANSNFYGFQYYDTIFLPIENENQFQISLTGFISGRTSDQKLKKYNATVIDTMINATRGLMAKFITNDNSEAYKQIYYYATIANNKYYWFYVYSPFSKGNDEEIKFFFKSIMFDSEKVKEKSFKLTPVHWIKNAE